MLHFKALNPPETVEVNKKTTFVSAVPAKVIFEYKKFLIQRLDDHQNRKRRIGQIAMSTAADLFFISVPVQQIKIYNNIPEPAQYLLCGYPARQLSALLPQKIPKSMI